MLAVNFSAALDMALNILFVVLGLGLVIFFHELGHFAVAKWCNVHVERFSIGFGPILWSRKRGETEYALSAIPFGGYVKMLGQDDMDPSQLTSEEIARDPRSYSAKTVPQRMAIISAGVIMNVITAVLFFAIAFRIGVKTPSSTLGEIQPGKPAWVAGLESGDTITGIDDREIATFGDIMRGVALTTGEINVQGKRPGGGTFEVSLLPDASGTRRKIGAGPAMSLKVFQLEGQKGSAGVPGSPSAAADPPLQEGDVIREVNGAAVTTYAELQRQMAVHRGETVTLTVQRDGDSDKPGALEKTDLAPVPFRTLGLQMEIGQVAAIRKNSPAEVAGLRVGDKITHVNNRDVGSDLDPLRLPDLFAELHGEDVEVRVKRIAKGEAETEEVIRIRPTERAGWTETPSDKDVPLSVPSIGAAFNLIPTVLKVAEGSPAASAGIEVRDRVRKFELYLPAGVNDGQGDAPVAVEFKENQSNWAHAFWLMQLYRQRSVRLTITHDTVPKTVEVTPAESADANWFIPSDRGLPLEALAYDQHADGVGSALSMGTVHAKNTILDIYLTLRNLVRRDLSYKELHGPLGIAAVAYKVAAEGLPELLLFLGFLSVNLAVLNFLPIPVLDGGHMVFLIWEGVTRRRPSERVLEVATYFGLAFVLGLMILVLYLDVFVHKLNL